MGQRLVHCSEHSGRVEEIFLPDDGPTELDANISIADAEWAEEGARRAGSQPGLVLWTDGSRDDNGAVGTRWRGRRDGAGPGGRPHGILSGGIRWEVPRHSACLSGGSGAIQANQARRVRIFADALAAITRMTHGKSGPVQTYALQAKKAIAALRER